jgi:GDP-mannose 6-dehydrogenase
VPVLNAVLTSNSHQVTLALDMILALQQRRIGFVGMSFKPDTDDIRESPLVELIERLIGKGFTVRILDTNISLKRLVGSNKRYVDEHLPHLASLLVDTPRALVDASEVIVLGHRSAVASEVVQSVRDDQFVIDLVRVLPDSTRHPQYEGMCW